MKLRSELTYGLRNTPIFSIFETVSSLELYMEGKISMTFCDVNYVKYLLMKVNLPCDTLSSLFLPLESMM